MVFRDDNKLLFCDGDLSEALRIHSSKIQDKVDAIPEDRFRSMSDDEIFQELQADLSITPLELDEDSRSMTKEETKVDVSDYGRDIHVDGIRVTISIPFHGDPQLWRMRPNNWRSTFPGGNIRFRHGSEKGMLEILIERPADEGSERIKKIYENNLDDIRFYLSSQKRQIETECARLPEQIRNAIVSRRTRLEKHKDLSEILDVPLKKEASGEVTLKSEDNNSHRVSKPKGRYQSSQAERDVFVSHASEDKDSFVRPLAEALRLRDLRVWYDEFSLKVGDSLRRSIDRGLSKLDMEL